MSRDTPPGGRDRLPDDPDRLRGRLYDVMDDDARSLADKHHRVLEIGRTYLGVENGHVERVREGSDTHEVVASVGGGADLLPEGAVLDRATTYCRRTLESNSPVALSDAPAQGWAGDPGYREHGFDCYLGTTVFADGEPYGTVCFVSRAPREDAFDGDEKAFVELVARLLGREIESHRHDRELDRREQDLRQSESKYESLLGTAPDAIVLADAETREIREANAAAVDLAGYAESELVGMDALDMHPPGDRDSYERAFDAFVDEGGTRDRFSDGSPLRVRRRDGSDVPVEMSASTVELDGRECVQAIIRDISERRERERDLRVKNRAIEEASVGITIADATDDDLPLVYANREFERVTGYDRERVLGENCRFLQGADTDEASVDVLRDAIEKREPVTTELLNYRADGTPFWNELTLTPVTDGAGAITHFVGFQRDVTARKRRERLVAVLNRVLRHNLRNDMTVVGNYAELLAGRDEEAVSEMAGHILETSRALTELSEKAQTLETAMREPVEPRERDVSADVSAVAATLRDDYPDAEITVDGDANLRAVATDRLAIALRELGENGIEHAGEAPTVTYRLDAEPDGHVRIHVSDSGPGLADVERQVLQTGFESPLEHGQGLGLWLVNWIVTSVGGRVSTTVDDGTTVTLALPTETDAAAEATVARYRQGAICKVRE